MSQTTGPSVVREVICAGCADLCDDLELTIEGDRIIGIDVDCPGAKAFFLEYRIEQVSPLVRGSEATWEDWAKRGRDWAKRGRESFLDLLRSGAR